MQRLLHRHVQHVINTLAFVFYLQCLSVIPFPVTNFTRHIDIRQKMHLYLQDSIPAAGLAAPSFYVKAEPSFFISFCLCISRCRKQITDQVKHPCICCRVGSGCTADGRLVDRYNLVKLFHSLDILVSARNRSGTVQISCKPLIQNLVDQGTLAGTGHTGDARHNSQRNLNVNLF